MLGTSVINPNKVPISVKFNNAPTIDKIIEIPKLIRMKVQNSFLLDRPEKSLKFFNTLTYMFMVLIFMLIKCKCISTTLTYRVSYVYRTSTIMGCGVSQIVYKQNKSYIYNDRNCYR